MDFPAITDLGEFKNKAQKGFLKKKTQWNLAKLCQRGQVKSLSFSNQQKSNVSSQPARQTDSHLIYYHLSPYLIHELTYCNLSKYALMNFQIFIFQIFIYNM